MKSGKKVVLLLLVITFVLPQLSIDVISLWPSFVALLSVLFLKKALPGLLIGAVSGVILIAKEIHFGFPLYSLQILPLLPFQAVGI